MKKYIFLSVLVFGMYLFQACDTKKEVVKDVPADKLENTYSVNMTDTLKIELASNPTTGFKWYLANKIKPKVITEFDREFIKDDRTMDMVGAGGYDTWRFLPAKSGETYLHFVYKREDGKTKGEKYFKIVIK